MRDDIGVVIAAAFDQVQKCQYYKKGLKACADFKSGKSKPVRKMNPVWDRISKEIQKNTRTAFNAESKLLKRTICLP